jgi:hypothetical protein
LLRSVKDHLEHLDDTPSLRAIEGALASLSESFSPGAIIRAYLANRANLSTIAARSYAHSNGFEKIVLEDQPGYKLRLHVWWRGNHALDSDVHNHSWDFASWVLIGGLCTELFTEVPADAATEPMEHYRFVPAVRNGRMSYELQHRGSCGLKRVFAATHDADTRYALQHRQLHTGNPDAERLTATLVLQTRTLAPESDIYRRTALSSPSTTTCKPFTADCLSRKLERLDAAFAELAVCTVNLR